MHFTQIKFNRSANQEFFKVLTQRVNSHFTSNNISKKGNRKMFVKTLIMLSIFLVPYTLLLAGFANSYFVFFSLWAIIGVGVAGIGLSVMHDANHGAYSNNESINKILSRMMELLGGSSKIWKLQHNVLHHTYTNIDGFDEDIDGPIVLRFSSNQKHRAIHRFQHVYAWFLYQFMSLVKVMYTDYSQAFHYRKIGLLKTNGEFAKALLDITFWKALYVVYMIVLPMVLLPYSPWAIILGFLVMHAVVGLFLATVFQAAHVMPDSSFPQPDPTGDIKNNWAVHQLMTTANFAPNNKWLSWFIGGLNYQIEHHLFAHICHVHYAEISTIVQATAEEFGIPYRSKNSFRAAILDHARMLYFLGRPPMALSITSSN